MLARKMADVATASVACAALATACSTGSGAGRSAPRSLSECSTAVQALARSDTARFARREVEALSASAAGGVTAVEQSDGAGRRILTVVYLGETGRVTYRFWLAHRHAYLVRVVEERYGEPLSTEAPAIAGRTEREHVVCGEAVAASSADSTMLVEVREVLAEADSLLTARRPNREP